MNESKQIAKRLKKVLLQDKIYAYEGLSKALEGDLRTLLSYYMNIVGDVSVNIDILDSVEYQVNVSAKANNISAPQVI